MSWLELEGIDFDKVPEAEVVENSEIEVNIWWGQNYSVAIAIADAKAALEDIEKGTKTKRTRDASAGHKELLEL